jgi:hypothetical protein
MRWFIGKTQKDRRGQVSPRQPVLEPCLPAGRNDNPTIHHGGQASPDRQVAGLDNYDNNTVV